MTRPRPPRAPVCLAATLLASAALLAPGRDASAGEGDAVSFARGIRPILSDSCFRCHGPDASHREAGLRLDTPDGATADLGGYAAVVPGEPEESELYLRVAEEVAEFRMPPPEAGKGLTADQVALIRRWIEQGAPWEGHWSFSPPTRPEPPEVRDASWPRNPIDRFVLSPLERDGIAPSPEADRATLIRRASLDVIGLPPTPEEVDAFVHDDRPDAYERLVDRLLASPHFGERWGRIWLDNARYADSNGYSIDAPRDIWLYRDWVIDAYNRDLPFDEFTIDQLAGDLRPDATTAQVVATGFHRNTPINQEGGIDKEQFRIESVMDRVATTGSVWLGLTVGCAQCHDHKYDPISQRDYYQLFAFLNTVDEPTIPVALPEDIARREEVERAVADHLDGIERDPELLALQRSWEQGLSTEQRQAQSQEVRNAFDATPFDQRTPEGNRVVFAAFIEQSDADEVKPHRQAIADLRKGLPKIPTTMVVREQRQPRETHLLTGGDFTRPAEAVGPGVPSALPPLEVEEGERPDRLDLARWIADPGNPLTGRVAVNRIWQAYFGRGIVETSEDLGTQGSPPSHPGLLDWLATEFVARDWSVKEIHRLILTSATYRQSSRLRPELAEADPGNRRLARQSRFRIDAELIRDSALVASGLLSTEVGGPGVFPQPEGVMGLGQVRRTWKPDEGPDRYRRGVYTYFWRATPHPLLVGFDVPDATLACTRRPRSNTPLQALMLLNDQAFYEFARALAGRVLDEGPGDDDGRLDLAFRLCLARSPDEAEADRLAALLDDQRGRSGSEREAWTAVARVLLNLDEFITRE